MKIKKLIFEETEKMHSMVKISRTQYINEALESYNKIQRRQLLEKRLKNESDLVKKESITILKEFENTLINLDIE